MLSRLLRYLRWLESGALVALFLAMLGVACYQIVIRNLFGTGLGWGDELVRMAVLWITMIGALAAIGQGGHIRIDIVERIANERWTSIVSIVANICAAVVCFLLAYFSIQFVVWEFQDGLAGIGVIPSWVLVAIIPFAGFAMGLRFLIQIFVKPQ